MTEYMYPSLFHILLGNSRNAPAVWLFVGSKAAGLCCDLGRVAVPVVHPLPEALHSLFGGTQSFFEEGKGQPSKANLREFLKILMHEKASRKSPLYKKIERVKKMWPFYTNPENRGERRDPTPSRFTASENAIQKRDRKCPSQGQLPSH